MPYWLPVRSRALHRRRFTTGLLQPFGQLLQVPRHRAESADLKLRFLIRRSPHQTSRYALLVDIDSTTHIVMYAHGASLTGRPTPYTIGTSSDSVTRPCPKGVTDSGRYNSRRRSRWLVSLLCGDVHQCETDFGSQHRQDSRPLLSCQYFSSFTLSRRSSSLL